jgi:hypothetical protein
VSHWFPVLLSISALLLSGCNVDFSTKASGHAGNGPVIAEGTIFTVTYEQTSGKLTTISRASYPPDGGGVWNVDAHGVLTADALVITYPGDRSRGPHVIPFDRIVDVRFGDYGYVKPGVTPAPADHGEHASGGH